MLLAGDNASVTEKIALRAAYLLARLPEKRRNTFRHIKKMYELRSKIVHSGFDVVSPVELRRLRLFSTLCVVRASESLDKFSNAKEFIDDLDENKFG